MLFLWLIYALNANSRQMIFYVLPSITAEFGTSPRRDRRHRRRGHRRNRTVRDPGDGVGGPRRARLEAQVSAPADRDWLRAVDLPHRYPTLTVTLGGLILCSS